MGERTLFPNASTKATLAYCWSQMQPDRVAFACSCAAIVLGHAGQRRRGTADLRRPVGPHHAPRRHRGPLAFLRAADRRLCAGPGGRDGLRAHRWLAQLGRHAALVRPRHHQRLRPPDRAQPRVAHGPALGRGHRDAGDVDVGLRRADRRHGLGGPAHQRHGRSAPSWSSGSSPGRSRSSWPRWSACSSWCCTAAWAASSRRRRTSPTPTRGRPGVIADTIANLTTVRSQAAEDREKDHVGAAGRRLHRRRPAGAPVFTTTRLQMESAMAFFNWAAGRGRGRAGAAPCARRRARCT